MVFLLKETFRFLRHSWASWIMGVVALGVALGVSGSFGMLAWKAHQGLDTLRSNLAIEAFFRPELSSQDAQAISDQDVKALSGVSRIEFISKEQAISDYEKESGENVQHVLGLNPLPASVRVYLTNPDPGSAASIESGLRAIEGIQEVRSNSPLVSAMHSRSRALDRIALIVGALMLLSAFFFAVIAGRHSFTLRKRASQTFRLLGVSKWSTRAPVTLAASLGGILGGAISIAMILLVRSQFMIANTGFSLSVTSREILTGSIILVALGIFIAAAGTFASGALRVQGE